MTMRVSLAELASAEIRLHPAEATALVALLCRRQASGELRGVPSPGIIRLTRDGDVAVEGPITTGDGTIARMAQLLSDLLPGFDAPPELRASGALRLVLARALRTLDLPAYASIEDFADALDRFAAPDPRASVCCLVRVWEEKKRTTQPVRTHLTISDVRRARRATGMTLDDVASVAAVPKPVLRELEWGYFRNWPHTDEARERIVRYARAAGLDEVVVFSIAWPLVEEAAASVEPAVTSNSLVPVGSQVVTVASRTSPASAPRPRRPWLRWVVAVAAVIMLAIATFAILGARTVKTESLAQRSAQVEEDIAPVSVAAPDSPRAEPALATTAVVAGAAAPRTPARVRKTSSPRSSRPSAAPATGRRDAERPRSFLHKEFFRIVFR